MYPNEDYSDLHPRNARGFFFFILLEIFQTLIFSKFSKIIYS